MRSINIRSYEELEDMLRNWLCFGVQREHEYDFGGMASLLGACLDNLQKHALEAELEDIGGYFT